VAALVPGWTGATPDDSAWNTCYLGDVRIPGICTISDIEVGVNVDTKTAKGSDSPTSTDNGVKPAEFTINVWLTERDWPEFQRVLPSFNPRRPGRERGPLTIVHPGANHLGIEHVRVLKIKTAGPTANGGKRYQLACVEWFDKPKPVKKPPKGAETPKGQQGPNTTVVYGENGVAERNRRQARREMSGLDPDFDPVTGKSNDPESHVAENLFDPGPPIL
jgi:hypothetical protein